MSDEFAVDLDSPPLVYWSRAITRIEERRKASTNPKDIALLDFMEAFAHNCLSEEIARQERE